MPSTFFFPLTVMPHLGALFLTGLPTKAQTIDANILTLTLPGSVKQMTKTGGEVRHLDARVEWSSVGLTANATLITRPANAPPSPPANRPNMLSDRIVTAGTGTIRQVWLTGPTRRYGHGVIGDAIEASGFGVELSNGKIFSFELGQDAV